MLTTTTRHPNLHHNNLCHKALSPHGKGLQHESTFRIILYVPIRFDLVFYCQTPKHIHTNILLPNYIQSLTMQTDSCPRCGVRVLLGASPKPALWRWEGSRWTARCRLRAPLFLQHLQRCLLSSSLSPSNRQGESQEKPGAHRPHCFLLPLPCLCSAPDARLSILTEPENHSPPQQNPRIHWTPNSTSNVCKSQHWGPGLLWPSQLTRFTSCVFPTASSADLYMNDKHPLIPQNLPAHLIYNT